MKIPAVKFLTCLLSATLLLTGPTAQAANQLSCAHITDPAQKAACRAKRSKYRNSGIAFYSGNELSFDICNPYVTSQQSGQVSTVNTRAFLDRWHDTAVELQIRYGIPWEGAMAQAALESGWGTSNFARNKNAYFGVNAVDSNPSAGYAYSDPKLSWYGQSGAAPSYAEFIVNNPRYRNHGAFNYPSDPIGYVTAIKAAGYATDPDYVAKLTNIINNIITPYSQEKGWQNSAGVTTENPETLARATENGAGATTATSTDSVLSSCNPTSPTESGPGGASGPAIIPGKTLSDGLPFDLSQTPSARVTSCMSDIRESISDEPHSGIDISMPVGTPLYSTMAGTIVHTGFRSGGFTSLGYFVWIDYGNGISVYYGHMQDGSATVKAGDKVSAGQLIGRSGNTGRSTGPHLHFQVKDGTQNINPLSYMGDISSIDAKNCYGR